jgi:hypothetical protein
VYVAVVAHAHPTQGKLLVKVQNGYELDELHNVSAQSPTTGQTIVWNGSTSLWEKSFAPVISGTTINNTVIGATTPAAGTFTTLIGGGGSANYFQTEGAATTKAVEAKALGSDTNIAFVIDSKGTGAIDLAAGSSGVNISNGGTVTAITRTAAGSGYATAPTVAISAPTTAGGVQATATCTVTAGAVNTTFTITNAGSGYVEQPTVTFSGGGGSGAAAYAVVGTASIIKGLGTSAVSGTTSASIVFQTPNTAVPALVLRDAAGTPDSFLAVTSNTSYVNVFPQGNANALLKIGSNGTGSLYLNTNGSGETNQMRVSHTASAVNYVQVTGAATGGTPTLSVQGSDTNINLTLTPKGTGSVKIGASPLATTNFSIVESGGVLLFKYGATTIASMSSTGLITSAANIVSNGTP